MSSPKDNGRSGREVYEIVLAVEEVLGSQLSAQELAELVNAADPPDENKRRNPYNNT